MGVQKSANFADKSTGNADEGGGGSKVPKIVRTYLMETPGPSQQHLEECDYAEGLEVLLDGAPAHPQQLLLRLAHHHLKHHKEEQGLYSLISTG